MAVEQQSPASETDLDLHTRNIHLPLSGIIHRFEKHHEGVPVELSEELATAINFGFGEYLRGDTPLQALMLPSLDYVFEVSHKQTQANVAGVSEELKSKYNKTLETLVDKAPTLEELRKKKPEELIGNEKDDSNGVSFVLEAFAVHDPEKLAARQKAMFSS